MSFNGKDGNGEHGVTHVKVPTITITLNPETLLVNFTCDNLAISLAQMMLDEARRQLDIQRRAAASIELQKQLAEAKRTAALVEGLNFTGSPKRG